jgi:chromosome partitioning protein
MPVIVFASPKGGVGKSTAAVLLGTQLAESGASVTMIDADPNKPVARWASRPGKPENLTLVDNVTEQTIIRAIDDAARKTAFVIVDLEGTASMMVVYAISRADLVIIPTSASLLDAVEAVSAVQLVQRQEEAFRIKIPSAVLFTKTSAAIRTRTLASIEAELDANDVPIFKSRIHDREAFRSLFSFGGTLSSLDPKQVRNIPAAVDDAQAFASEVIELLKSQRAAVAAVA